MGCNCSENLTNEFVEAVYNATRMFGEPFEKEDIKADLLLKDIPGWDSLNQIAFSISLEKTYGLKQGSLVLDGSLTMKQTLDAIQNLK